MRKTILVGGEFYHIYNRGVDKREIVSDIYDANRFVTAMIEFNTIEPIGSIYNVTSKRKNGEQNNRKPKTNKLVEVVCYCLNPNHFHFVLKQVADEGISKFMHRLSTGHTKYYNEKYERTGALFQGSFKAKYIAGNDYLLHLSAYVNLNNKLHHISGDKESLVRSSYNQYSGGKTALSVYYYNCDLDIVLGQFSNKKEYKIFANESIVETERIRYGSKYVGDLLIDNNL